MASAENSSHNQIEGIASLPFVEQFIHIDKTESTNLIARQVSIPGPDTYTVIWAETQTGGKGRRGKSFFSSHRGGLWASILVPVTSLSSHFSVNRALSLAICECLEKLYDIHSVKIKWPNDIYIQDRKVCGVLLESMASEKPCVIAGFGINVYIDKHDFPASLRESATSVSQVSAITVPRHVLLEEILNSFHCIFKRKNEEVHNVYRQRLLCLHKHALVDGKKWYIQDVASDGRLEVMAQDRTEYLHSGTLTFLP